MGDSAATRRRYLLPDRGLPGPLMRGASK